MWLLTAWRCVLKMLKESFGHSLLHWYYCDDVDPIVISSRCPSVLLCLVGDFFFVEFPHGKFAFPKLLSVGGSCSI